ncbi:MAG TPA: hypothetical protein PK395_12135 [bacterium]|nr:hypothetical protein [bacterium]
MKKIFLLPLIAVFGVPLVVFTQENGLNADGYREQSRKLPIADRLELAKQTVLDSADEAVLSAAVADLAKYAITPERNEAALESVNLVLRKCSRDSDLYGQALLAKARLTARAGQKQEGYSLFRREIAECRQKSAYGEFFTSLWENGDYELSALEDYKRHTGDELSDAVRTYYDCHGNLIKFYTRLRVIKTTRKDYSAVASALPQALESQRRPLAKPIAEAICLAVDERYPEALEKLRKIDETLQSGKAPESAFDESKDLPFYIASVLFFEGQDFEAMRTAFRQYMDRNTENRPVVLERALNLLYASEFDPFNLFKRVPELSGFLIASEYMTDENIKSGLSDEKIAALLNIHRHGLWYQGKAQEAERMALDIMAKYYPQTLEGANAALSLAAYSLYLHEDRDATDRIMYDILEKAPYEQIVPHAKAWLAGSAYMRGDIERAQFLIQEVLDEIGPEWQGSFRECREAMLRLRDKIENGESVYEIKDGRLIKR